MKKEKNSTTIRLAGLAEELDAIADCLSDDSYEYPLSARTSVRRAARVVRMFIPALKYRADHKMAEGQILEGFKWTLERASNAMREFWATTDRKIFGDDDDPKT